jgi:Skp family chaperone for outer membrane proteins
MIRNTMFGLSLLALTATSAFAAPVAKHHTTARIVAQAPAGDTAAPADKAAPAKKEKKAKKEKAPKAEGAKDSKEMKAAPEKAPAPATK